MPCQTAQRDDQQLVGHAAPHPPRRSGDQPRTRSHQQPAGRRDPAHARLERARAAALLVDHRTVRRDVSIGSTAFRARDGHSVGVRTYRPRPGGAGPLPVLVWLHGGGWVLGNTRSYDPICTAIAHAAGVLVLSVDYRLAPEFRAPQSGARLRRRRPLGGWLRAARWAPGPTASALRATPPAPTCLPSSRRSCGPRGAPT